MFQIRALMIATAIITALPAFAREWTDESGHYKLFADIVAYSDKTVVLRKPNSDLVAVSIDKLSNADRDFLSKASLDQTARPSHIWKLKSGLNLQGRMDGFCIHDVVIERRMGRVYVNSRRYDKMPGVYRAIIPKIVEHFTGEKVEGENGLKAWVKALKNEPRTFKCSGVMIELDDDDLYCAPFFIFTEEVVEMLKPGWERWLAAKQDYEKKEQESFLAHAQAEAYQRQQAQAKQIQQLQLNIQAYDAGVFDLWEVAMYPPTGQYGRPLSVVVPARNNVQAAELAKRQNPRYVVGPMRVVPRRN